jgi:hypothetical protein
MEVTSTRLLSPRWIVTTPAGAVGLTSGRSPPLKAFHSCSPALNRSDGAMDALFVEFQDPVPSRT